MITPGGASLPHLRCHGLTGTLLLLLTALAQIQGYPTVKAFLRLHEVEEYRGKRCLSGWGRQLASDAGSGGLHSMGLGLAGCLGGWGRQLAHRELRLVGAGGGSLHCMELGWGSAAALGWGCSSSGDRGLRWSSAGLGAVRGAGTWRGPGRCCRASPQVPNCAGPIPACTPARLPVPCRPSQHAAAADSLCGWGNKEVLPARGARRSDARSRRAVTGSPGFPAGP